MEPLTPEELRVAACLVEKQLTTPDSYPLTENAVVAACNQLSNRNPVVAYDNNTVRVTLTELRQRGLARVVHTPGARVPKHKHILDEALGLSKGEVAILTVLALRGPQTVGELRTRTERMHDFAGLSEVEETLEALGARDEPLAVRLERQPGQKEARFAQLLGGPVDAASSAYTSPPPAAYGSSGAGHQPPSGAAAYGSSGAGHQPPSGAAAYGSSGAGHQPPSGAAAYGSSGAGHQPPSGAAAYGSSGAGHQPPSGAAAYGSSGAGHQPPSGAAAYGSSGAGDQPPSGAAAYGSSGAGDQPSSGAAAYGSSGAGDQPSSGAAASAAPATVAGADAGWAEEGRPEPTAPNIGGPSAPSATRPAGTGAGAGAGADRVAELEKRLATVESELAILHAEHRELRDELGLGTPRPAAGPPGGAPVAASALRDDLDLDDLDE